PEALCGDAGTMGWEPGTSASVRARYLNVPDAMLEDVAWKIVDAIWETPETPAVDKNPAGTTKSEDNVEGPHRDL
ncbi:hypothetical protein ACFT2A_34455, partial [Streptomyces sp. NPDC057072]